MVACRSLVALGFCVGLAACDRNEAKGTRRNGRFQEADIAMSRLQVASEEQGSSLLDATACAAEAVRLESMNLKAALLQRMSSDHGAAAASKLESALGRKNDSSESKCEQAAEMSPEERTKLMMGMDPKKLVKYWLPSDCQSVVESEEAKKTMAQIEKDYGTGKAPDVDLSGSTTDSEVQEEKTLTDHCHEMIRFLTQAAHQLQVVKKAIASEPKPSAEGEKKETTPDATKNKPETQVDVTATAKSTPEVTAKGGASLIQLSNFVEAEAEGFREYFDAAMRAVLGTVTERLHWKPAVAPQLAENTVASIHIDAHGSAVSQQRETRSKQVARHDV